MAYKDKEKQKAYRRTYYQLNKERLKLEHAAHYFLHWEERKAQRRAYRPAIFKEALKHLGDKCACPGCEVSEPAFLTIDHIHGRTKGIRKEAVNEARDSGWDKTQFQILCYNCNCSKKYRAFCPVHQRKQEERNGHNPVANAQQAP